MKKIDEIFNEGDLLNLEVRNQTHLIEEDKIFFEKNEQGKVLLKDEKNGTKIMINYSDYVINNNQILLFSRKIIRIIEGGHNFDEVPYPNLTILTKIESYKNLVNNIVDNIGNPFSFCYIDFSYLSDMQLMLTNINSKIISNYKNYHEGDDLGEIQDLFLDFLRNSLTYIAMFGVVGEAHKTLGEIYGYISNKNLNDLNEEGKEKIITNFVHFLIDMQNTIKHIQDISEIKNQNQYYEIDGILNGILVPIKMNFAYTLGDEGEVEGGDVELF